MMGRRSIGLFVLLLTSAGLPVVTVAQQDPPDRGLLAFINTIKAVDNHSHGLPAETGTLSAEPEDPLGTSPPFFARRQRETNTEWVDAWRALYGYRYADFTRDHVREAFRAKRNRMEVQGTRYPEWVLDQAGIDVALINASELGAGQTAARFRWVPYADGFLFPFPTTGFTANLTQRLRTQAGLNTLPPLWSDYLALIGSRLREWKAREAVAVKLTIAYYRALDFAPRSESEARTLYERFVQEGNTLPRDYRTPDYKALQDFLFRYVAREAGRAGLVVHVHTGEGGGPLFGTAGADPLLLEPVVNDVSLSQTTFVLVHGGFPFDRAVTALIQKPNVYADVSGQTFFRSPHDLGETLRQWLWAFPEKVLFGTDAFTMSPLRGWEEMAWLATRSGREALALALTRMMFAGEITRSGAENIARLVLRENAIKLYGLTSVH